MSPSATPHDTIPLRIARNRQEYFTTGKLANLRGHFPVVKSSCRFRGGARRLPSTNHEILLPAPRRFDEVWLVAKPYGTDPFSASWRANCACAAVAKPTRRALNTRLPSRAIRAERAAYGDTARQRASTLPPAKAKRWDIKVGHTKGDTPKGTQQRGHSTLLGGLTAASRTGETPRGHRHQGDTALCRVV